MKLILNLLVLFLMGLTIVSCKNEKAAEVNTNASTSARKTTPRPTRGVALQPHMVISNFEKVVKLTAEQKSSIEVMVEEFRKKVQSLSSTTDEAAQRSQRQELKQVFYQRVLTEVLTPEQAKVVEQAKADGKIK